MAIGTGKNFEGIYLGNGPKDQFVPIKYFARHKKICLVALQILQVNVNNIDSH